MLLLQNLHTVLYIHKVRQIHIFMGYSEQELNFTTVFDEVTSVAQLTLNELCDFTGGHILPKIGL